MFGGVKAFVRLFLALIATALLLGSCHTVLGDFEISTQDGVGTTNDGLCRAGEFKCNREFLLTCNAEREWEPRDTCATAAQCDQKAGTCTICPKAGDRRCNGAVREVCNATRSNWDSLGSCDAADQCSPTHCGDCTPGELQCSGPDSLELQVCTANNRWQSVAQCASAPLCNASVSMGMADMTWTPACMEKQCVKGTLSCDGSVLSRCRQGEDGLDRVDTCLSPALCQMAAASPPETQTACPMGCGAAGSFRCNGQDVEQCAFDQTTWSVIGTCSPETPCDSDTGECGSPCVPGTNRCNSATLESCSAEQAWVVEKTCDSAALCDAAGGQCKPRTCNPEEVRCNPDNLAVRERCNADLTKFDPVATCATPALCGCAIDGTCLAGVDEKGCGFPICMPNMDGSLPLQCNSANPKVVEGCDATLNAWNTLATCGAEEFCYPADPTDPCKSECPTSGYLCNGSELLGCGLEGPFHQADCATATLCDCVLNGTCAAGISATGCGSPLCGGTLASNQCSDSTLQSCQVGRNGWDNTVCDAETLCYPGVAPTFVGGYCAICEIAGVIECTDTATSIHTCAPDRRSFTAETACAFGCLERPGPSADYCAACAVGELRCNGNMPGTSRVQQCNADQTGLMDTGGFCTSGCLENGLADACALCQTGELRCDGTNLMRCNTARTGFDLQTACNPSCIDMGLTDYCGTCTPSATQCAGDLLQTCQTSGSWNAGSNCANGCVVKDGNDNCAPTCRPGTYRCNGSPASTLQQCNVNGDGWTTIQTCAANDAGTGGAALCDATQGRCDACAAGDFRCSTGTLQDCNANGDWRAASSACSGTTLRTCGSGTGAATAQACTICDASNRECDDCNPTTEPYSCSSGTLRSCNASGHWVSGANNCSGSTLRTCTGNTLNAAQACTICDETNNECDDCSGTTLRCTGAGNTTLQSCNSTGHWANSPACPSTGATRYACSNGTTAPVTASCPVGQTCNAAQTQCNMCDNGQTRCFDMDTQETCSGMMWSSALECGVPGCLNNTCNDCVPTTWKTCNAAETQLLTCAANGDYPTTGMACPNGCYGTEPNSYCGDCTPGDTTCASGSVRTCGANGRYPTTGGTACGANGCFEPTAGDAACGVCPGTTQQCMGDQRQTCGMGQWTNTGTVCAGVCYMNGATATCGECNANGDCTGGEVCNTTAHTCVECVTAANCAMGEICSSTNECVECEDDGDCSGGVCNTTTNQCQECEDDGDCTGDEVCSATNECVECEATGDCGANEVCNTSTNVCVACLANADCTDTMQVCNTTNNTCVECTATAQMYCTAGNEVCRTGANTCVECNADADCADTTEVCNTTNNTCVECLAGNTIRCGVDEVCKASTNLCVECNTTADCTDTMEVCNTTTNICVQCLVDGDCPALTPTCTSNVCE